MRAGPPHQLSAALSLSAHSAGARHATERDSVSEKGSKTFPFYVERGGRSFLSAHKTYQKLRMHMLTASGVLGWTHCATMTATWELGSHTMHSARCTQRLRDRTSEISDECALPHRARPRPPRSRHAQVRSEDGRARALAHGGTGRAGVVGGCSVAVQSKG